jgi:predicted kinase
MARPKPPGSLIIVTGLPAAGKSRFATRLAAELGWPLLAKDAVKEPLLDQFAGSDAALSRALSDMSFALLFALAPPLLEAAPGVVLEGNFRPGEHEAGILPLLRGDGRVVQLLCRVAEPLRQARLAARAGDPGRHAGHRDAAAAAADPRGDAYLSLPGGRLLLRGDAQPEECDAMIARLLAIFPVWPHMPFTLSP